MRMRMFPCFFHQPLVSLTIEGALIRRERGGGETMKQCKGGREKSDLFAQALLTRRM
jgi:hypothetical protein